MTADDADDAENCEDRREEEFNRKESEEFKKPSLGRPRSKLKGGPGQ
jgi:hypothetical protein